MAEEIKDQPETSAADDDSGRGYERSKIVFPYGDLDDGIEVVKPIYNRGGHAASFDQLVAWMGHDNVASGTFRVKIAAARIFGLILMDKDSVALTALGRDINDPQMELATRAKAFLEVPLYRKIFDTYKGGPLPTKDSDLEATIESFGVASKQAKRARQTFQRSAEQAKVFNEKKDRLVLPAGVSLDSSKAPNGGANRKMDIHQEQERPIAYTSEINPAIAAFIEDLPPDGEWTQAERDVWARIFLRTLDKIYKIKE